MKLIKDAMSWMRKRPLRSLMMVFLLICVAVFMMGQVMDSLKVIDPHDPRFDPMKFRFEDYAGLHTDPEPELLTPALLKMFPPGTEKVYIDRILVDQAGLQKDPLESTQKMPLYIAMRHLAALPAVSFQSFMAMKAEIFLYL